jgi:GT2 family glycosyltransferase
MNMIRASTTKAAVVVPNWNGADDLPACLNSLLAQSLNTHIIVVDNGSVDNSLDLIESKYKTVEIIKLSKNYGFDGGVNAGIKKALADGFEYIALFNNDAVADKKWLGHLVSFLDKNSEAGIVTSKIVDQHNTHIDSTGDIYTVWGLAFPRGRGEEISSKYDNDIWIFGASGGASLYRSKLFEEIGIFDEDFFAYYEDVDISFRAQLAGWKIAYEPKAVVRHQIGATSSKIKNFTIYHTLKNYPQVFWKNVPLKLFPLIFPRFVLAYFMIWGRAVSRGQIWASTKGVLMSLLLLPRKLIQRRKIQKNRNVSIEYISSIITHDLPPNAHNLRGLRQIWWRISRKKSAL